MSSRFKSIMEGALAAITKHERIPPGLLVPDHGKEDRHFVQESGGGDRKRERERESGRERESVSKSRF